MASHSDDYDLEFKSNEDDAWYSVNVHLDSKTETLTVKFSTSPAVYVAAFTAGQFQTAGDIYEFVSRFRPISQQLQDDQCSKVKEGVKVCAALKDADDDDVRFYDALVEAVHKKEHAFARGEEVCQCSFILSWLHGPDCGNITSGAVEDICIIQSADQVDPRIAAFSELAKAKNLCGLKSTSGGTISRHNQQRDEDRDIGGEFFNILGSLESDGQHFVLIDNLEKDLLPSSIKQFIHQQTGVLPQACVFPRLSLEPFARGVIVVDCKTKFEKINKFLKNPNHFIVSTRGRPWVIVEEGSRREMFEENLRSLVPLFQDPFQNKIVDRQLTIVKSGSEAYKRAIQLRNMFLEFVSHQQGLYERLNLEDELVLQS